MDFGGEVCKSKVDKNERAIQLIAYSSTEGFNVTVEGKEFIKSLKGKLGIIAIAGRYRTGKSFLLNRVIMGRLEGGFGVGSTINACTKGIWVWGKPTHIKAHNGEEFDVLIMDTEGIGAIDEDQNHDTRIFLLATLLSSLLIYNSIGTIDENALQNISLIVNMSRQLQVRAHSSGNTDPEELKSYFPSFLWVLRDFALRLTDLQQNPITPKQYLENSLLPQKGSSDSTEMKNCIRRVIASVFSERDCFPLVRPLEDEKAIQSLQSVPDENLRPEFLDQIKSLRMKVSKKVRPKKLNGSYITGEMLLELCESYTKAFNTGGVPCIESAWNYVCRSQCQKTINELLAKYQSIVHKCAEDSSYDIAKVKQLHKELKPTLLKEFKELSVREFVSDYEETMNKLIAEKYKEIKETCNKKLTVILNNKCRMNIKPI